MNKVNYERWANLIKDKRQMIRQNNREIIRRIEPQIRELKDSFTISVTNSAAVDWVNKWVLNSEESGRNSSKTLPASLEVAELQSQLQPLLGQELFCSDWTRVDQEQINAFATVTGDQQWIHVDPDRARKESPFRSTIAHGMLILSLIPYLRSVYEEPLYKGSRLIVNQGFNSVRLLAPVKPGQMIRVRSTLADLSHGRRHIDLIEYITVEREVDSNLNSVAKVEISFRIYL